MRHRVFLTVLALLLAGQGDSRSESLAAKDVESAVFMETIAMPTPGEFFIALGKQCQPNWAKLLKSSTPPTTTDRERMALQLGVFVADGFIAIEAQDGQGVKNTGRDILAITKKLNVSQHIIARSQSISDFAEESDWNTLREELDATQNDVRLALLEQNDNALVVLTMTGSWMRQMDVAAQLLAEDYKPGPSALHVQPAIATHLINRIDALPDKTRNLPLVVGLRDGLDSARTHMLKGSAYNLSAAAVKELSATMSSLIAGTAEPSEKK